MLVKIPGDAQEDSGECSRIFREILKKILGNAQEYSGECYQRFSRMLKKIECFIMKLNQNRIKGYILKCNQKCAQKFIKTSHMNENVKYNNLFFFFLKNNQPVHKALTIFIKL